MNDVRGSRLTLIGSVLGVIGLAVFIFEATRPINGDTILSSTAQLLMWIGLGLTALGGLLLVAGAWSAAADLTTGPSEE